MSAKSYSQQNEFEKARESYFKAREFDTLRLRADRRINETIREVADERARAGVYLVDAVKTLEAHSPHGIPGQELFYEHVHLKFAENYLVAQSIFEQVRRILPQRIKARAAKDRSSSTPPLDIDHCAEVLAYTEFDRYQMAKHIHNKFLIKRPFTNQLGNSELVQPGQTDSSKRHSVV